ncbi:MAG: hypothetical protein KAH31_12330, partial [Candidatus Sabulitectum sp.]|nr:hypothetical protein [Candidatus Sabulitectum sp.]
RDNSDFQQFHIQSTILAEETAANLESVRKIVETNFVEAIAEGNGELLEDLVLQRESTFVLASDSTTISAGLARAAREVEETAFAIDIYSLLLAETTESQSIAYELNSLTMPGADLLTALIATLVEHGTIEHDAEKACISMKAASPAIESISQAMAEQTEAWANAVQAAYSDMSARRQRIIIDDGYPQEAVIELLELNLQVTVLLGEIEIIHDGWLTIPAIHNELINSLTETSISTTLRILAERMDQIREEEL